jgi:hypothetical protein
MLASSAQRAATADALHTNKAGSHATPPAHNHDRPRWSTHNDRQTSPRRPREPVRAYNAAPHPHALALVSSRLSPFLLCSNTTNDFQRKRCGSMRSDEDQPGHKERRHHHQPGHITFVQSDSFLPHIPIHTNDIAHTAEPRPTPPLTTTTPPESSPSSLIIHRPPFRELHFAIDQQPAISTILRTGAPLEAVTPPGSLTATT